MKRARATTDKIFMMLISGLYRRIQDGLIRSIDFKEDYKLF